VGVGASVKSERSECGSPSCGAVVFAESSMPGRAAWMPPHGGVILVESSTPRLRSVMRPSRCIARLQAIPGVGRLGSLAVARQGDQ
jgi:hypothetical protein